MLKALHAKIDDPNVIRVYVATLGLGSAYGMAISVISVFLNERGYSETDIGSLAAWFAAGIMAMAIASDYLVKRFSAKVVLVAALFTYATTVALFPFAPGYAAMGALRFVDGAASVCVWVASETILLARAQRAIELGIERDPQRPHALQKLQAVRIALEIPEARGHDPRENGDGQERARNQQDKLCK